MLFSLRLLHRASYIQLRGLGPIAARVARAAIGPTRGTRCRARERTTRCTTHWTTLQCWSRPTGITRPQLSRLFRAPRSPLPRSLQSHRRDKLSRPQRWVLRRDDGYGFSGSGHNCSRSLGKGNTGVYLSPGRSRRGFSDQPQHSFQPTKTVARGPKFGLCIGLADWSSLAQRSIIRNTCLVRFRRRNVVGTHGRLQGAKLATDALLNNRTFAVVLNNVKRYFLEEWLNCMWWCSAHTWCQTQICIGF